MGKFKLVVVYSILLFSMPDYSYGQDLGDLANAAFDAAEKARDKRKGDPNLTEKEKKKLKNNYRRQVSKHSDRDGELDNKAVHFIESVEEYDDTESFYRHVTGCRVCNPFLKALLSGTGIRRFPYYPPRKKVRQCFPATYCSTQFGNCGMGVAGPSGVSCYCPTPNGPVWGVSRC